MRTARAWGKPPSLWWGENGKNWTRQDRLLTLALTAYEDSLCSGCGQPKDVAYNPDAEGWFEAQEIVCAGCAARHQHDTQQQQATPGGKVYVVDGRPPGLELRPWSLSGADVGNDSDDDGDDSR